MMAGTLLFILVKRKKKTMGLAIVDFFKLKKYLISMNKIKKKCNWRLRSNKKKMQKVDVFD